MIKAFRLIRNIGCFDSFQGTPDTELAPLTLIYAENGRGKTTLSAILRSLATRDATLIKGRRRIGSEHEPHIVLEVDGKQQAVVFQNDQWSESHDPILIFDDQFVDDNVYSGLSVEAGHRQNLHEVILGSHGVGLARLVDDLTDQIADLNQQLREKQAAIPKEELFGLDVDTFCDLEQVEDVGDKITEIEKKADALKQVDRVRSERFFSKIDLPEIDLPEIERILSQQITDLDQDAVGRVQAHVQKLGDGSERWLAEGVPRIVEVDEPTQDALCPFCGQSVVDVSLVDMYRAYFGEAYRHLQDGITKTQRKYELALGGDALAQCQRAIGAEVKRHDFWKDLASIPDLHIDVESFAGAWSAARDAILDVLSRKKAAPLEAVSASPDHLEAIRQFQQAAQSVEEQIEHLVGANDQIGALKESTQADDADLVDNELRRLKAAKARHSEDTAPLCEEYVAARTAKQQAEENKRQARKDLDTHRRQVFPAYKDRVNHYLQRFGANFRLGDVQPQDRAGRPSTSYHLVIRESEVALAIKSGADLRPCFANALSAGDRSTLALAFFFASADLDREIADKIVVVDDPVSSLDDGRMESTLAEVRRLGGVARQLVVLSHTKAFLCRLHHHAKQEDTASLLVRRVQDDSSALVPWEPSDDKFTEYDRRHTLVRDFLDGTAPSIRQVAQSLRPVMEAYLRVTDPEHCPPGTLLGPYRNHLQNLADAGNPVMSAQKLQELAEITEYANRFHHDTNPAYEAEHISDNELRNFAQRVLTFIQP